MTNDNTDDHNYDQVSLNRMYGNVDQFGLLSNSFDIFKLQVDIQMNMLVFTK